MSEPWFPTISYIENLFRILRQQYPDLCNVYDIDKNIINGILDRLEHGLPFKKLSLIQRAARYIYDMTNLHPFSDGNKRIAYFSTETLLLKNGYKISANNYEKEKFMENISTSSEDDEYDDKIEYTENWLGEHCEKQ